MSDCRPGAAGSVRNSRHRRPPGGAPRRGPGCGFGPGGGDPARSARARSASSGANRGGSGYRRGGPGGRSARGGPASRRGAPGGHPSGRARALAGDGARRLAERRLRAPLHRHSGHRGGGGVDDGHPARVGARERARRAVRVRGGVVARAVPRPSRRAAGDARHRLSQVVVVGHRRHGDGRGGPGRLADGGRPRSLPRAAARQDRADAAGARGADADRGRGAADGRRAARRGGAARRADPRRPGRTRVRHQGAGIHAASAVLRRRGGRGGGGPRQRLRPRGRRQRALPQYAAHRRGHDIRGPRRPVEHGASGDPGAFPDVRGRALQPDGAAARHGAAGAHGAARRDPLPSRGGGRRGAERFQHPRRASRRRPRRRGRHDRRPLRHHPRLAPAPPTTRSGWPR